MIFFLYVDGIQIPPQKMLPPKSNTSPKIYPAYLSWQYTDQLILSILFSSLTESMIGHVISTGTSCELWVALGSMFRAHFKAKEFQIRFELTNLSRGEQSILDYFSKVKMLADTLAATGNPLPDK